MTFAVAVGSIVLTSLTIYWHAEWLRERKRANTWQAKCSDRTRELDHEIEARKGANLIIDDLECQIRQMRHICGLLGDADVNPSEIKRDWGY